MDLRLAARFESPSELKPDYLEVVSPNSTVGIFQTEECRKKTKSVLKCLRYVELLVEETGFSENRIEIEILNYWTL